MRRNGTLSSRRYRAISPCGRSTFPPAALPLWNPPGMSYALRDIVVCPRDFSAPKVRALPRKVRHIGAPRTARECQWSRSVPNPAGVFLPGAGVRPLAPAQRVPLDMRASPSRLHPQSPEPAFGSSLIGRPERKEKPHMSLTASSPHPLSVSPQSPHPLRGSAAPVIEPPWVCRRLHLLGRMGSCQGDRGATRRSCENVLCGWSRRSGRSMRLSGLP